jgi:inorganic pyrophosphatase
MSEEEYDNKIKVYIEIEKGSNIKYEFCKKNKKLMVDRILDDPFRYVIGFINKELSIKLYKKSIVNI